MLFGLRHSYLDKFLTDFFFVFAYVCLFFVVVRHILDKNRSQLPPQDVKLNLVKHLSL